MSNFSIEIPSLVREPVPPFLVWLPGLWPSLNAMKEGAGRGGGHAGNHWNRIKKAWQNPAQLLIKVALREYPKQRPLFHKPVCIEYIHTRKERRGDPSNFAAAVQKIVEDALVAEGVIADDSFAQIHTFQHVFNFVGPVGVKVMVSEVR